MYWLPYVSVCRSVSIYLSIYQYFSSHITFSQKKKHPKEFLLNNVFFIDIHHCLFPFSVRLADYLVGCFSLSLRWSYSLSPSLSLCLSPPLVHKIILKYICLIVLCCMTSTLHVLGCSFCQSSDQVYIEIRNWILLWHYSQIRTDMRNRQPSLWCQL